MDVRGRVQGVGYRCSMRQRATEVGVAGWVRNRRDGSVEAEVEGTEQQVEQMLTWVAEGPPMAAVDGVKVSDVEPTDEAGFDALPTI